MFNPNMEYDRGLVLNSRSYNEQNALVHERIYTYQYLYRPGTPLPTKVWGVQYHKFPNASGFHYAKYGLLTDFAKVLASETETVYDAQNSAAPGVGYYVPAVSGLPVFYPRLVNVY